VKSHPQPTNPRVIENKLNAVHVHQSFFTSSAQIWIEKMIDERAGGEMMAKKIPS
jgi:hypothetical protein